ncbi:MAG: DNA polymerase, partial [Pseudomonadales bacterium]|nr:DNA polymerase [Pseudomonadales bacterium]
PFSYALILVDRFGTVLRDSFYVGLDAVERFIDEMLDIETMCLDNIRNPVPMKLTAEDRKVIATATHCHICKWPLQPSERKVCRDHDHLTGRFLGMAHDQCNLERREQEKVTSFCMNFSGYDSHLLLKHLSKFKHKIDNIYAIPLNTQKFKMLAINRIVFLDSLAFLQDSLEKVTDTLVASNHNFPLLKQKKWANIVSDKGSLSEEECHKLLLRKGVYPYMFATSIARLEQAKQLPDREYFFHEIGEEPVSEEDYAHAQRVWNGFNCANMIDYTKVYNLLDVFLLGEGMFDLRESIYKEYELDICNYLSLPMLSKDLMLSKTKAQIELMTDVEMSACMQYNIRGGLSYINRRYVDVTKMNEE